MASMRQAMINFVLKLEDSDMLLHAKRDAVHTAQLCGYTNVWMTGECALVGEVGTGLLSAVYCSEEDGIAHAGHTVTWEGQRPVLMNGDMGTLVWKARR